MEPAVDPATPTYLLATDPAATPTPEASTLATTDPTTTDPAAATPAASTPATTDPATRDSATRDSASRDSATTGSAVDAEPVGHADENRGDDDGDHTDHGHDPQWGYSDHKDAYQKRLRRIEGQVRGLQRMIDEDKYCIDIVTQVSAVTRALQSVALELIEEHLGHCVAQAIVAGGAEAEDKVKEASAAVARLVRS
jgi:CsoR family transcriptional regulator, copper-sensing transcriptional repressor